MLITDNAGDLDAALPDGGVLLALDLGTKTIGTALCDAGWRFATAGKTLPRGKFSRDAESLRALAKDRRVAAIVIGLPRNMDGSEGPRAQASRAYARNIANALELPVLLWDERWSTASADARIGGTGYEPGQTRDADRQPCGRRHPAGRDRHAGRWRSAIAIDAIGDRPFPFRSFKVDRFTRPSHMRPWLPPCPHSIPPRRRPSCSATGIPAGWACSIAIMARTGSN